MGHADAQTNVLGGKKLVHFRSSAFDIDTAAFAASASARCQRSQPVGHFLNAAFFDMCNGYSSSRQMTFIEGQHARTPITAQYNSCSWRLLLQKAVMGGGIRLQCKAVLSQERGPKLYSSLQAESALESS